MKLFKKSNETDDEVTDMNESYEEHDAAEDETTGKDESGDKNAASEEDSSGVYKLKHPITVEGKKITEIEYDFNSVKPIQYINLVAKLNKKEQISVPELNMNVQIWYFSYACGISVADLKSSLSTQDFTVICAKVRNFLLGVSDTDSEED